MFGGRRDRRHVAADVAGSRTVSQEPALPSPGHSEGRLSKCPGASKSGHGDRPGLPGAAAATYTTGMDADLLLEHRFRRSGREPGCSSGSHRPGRAGTTAGSGGEPASRRPRASRTSRRAPRWAWSTPPACSGAGSSSSTPPIRTGPTATASWSPMHASHHCCVPCWRLPHRIQVMRRRARTRSHRRFRPASGGRDGDWTGWPGDRYRNRHGAGGAAARRPLRPFPGRSPHLGARLRDRSGGGHRARGCLAGRAAAAGPAVRAVRDGCGRRERHRRPDGPLRRLRLVGAQRRCARSGGAGAGAGRCSARASSEPDRLPDPQRRRPGARDRSGCWRGLARLRQPRRLRPAQLAQAPGAAPAARGVRPGDGRTVAVALAARTGARPSGASRSSPPGRPRGHRPARSTPF